MEKKSSNILLTTAMLLFLLVFFGNCRRSSDFSLKNESDVFGKIPQPNHNLMSRKGVELGRMLFYDQRLSSDNTVSCASCHIQSLAFSEASALSSRGVSGRTLERHVPALINSAWSEHGLFWDGGAKNLESLAFAPLQHPDEMGQDLKEMVQELKSIPEYKRRFHEVFGGEITSAYVVRALAQFQRTLVSDESEYDLFIKKEKKFSAEALKGLELFRKNCETCHREPFFTDHHFHNNGLDTAFLYKSPEDVRLGRFRISFDSADLGKYKTPSLRNTAYTAPYMHDGRFRSLREVIDHYSEGIQPSSSLDTEIPNKGFRFNENEKKALIHFLESLSDEKFLQNPNFSEPDKLP